MNSLIITASVAYFIGTGLAKGVADHIDAKCFGGVESTRYKRNNDNRIGFSIAWPIIVAFIACEFAIRPLEWLYRKISIATFRSLEADPWRCALAARGLLDEESR